MTTREERDAALDKAEWVKAYAEWEKYRMGKMNKSLELLIAKLYSKSTDDKLTVKDALRVAIEYGNEQFNSGYTIATEQAVKTSELVMKTLRKG